MVCAKCSNPLKGALFMLYEAKSMIGILKVVIRCQDWFLCSLSFHEGFRFMVKWLYVGWSYRVYCGGFRFTIRACCCNQWR